MTDPVSESDVQRMIWRARRGLLELDLLFGPFVRDHYRNLDAAERDAFARLLDIDDPDLLEWFSGRSTPDEAEFSQLVAKILAAKRSSFD